MPYNMEIDRIVAIDYCDVTSSYLHMYSVCNYMWTAKFLEVQAERQKEIPEPIHTYAYLSNFAQ